MYPDVRDVRHAASGDSIRDVSSTAVQDISANSCHICASGSAVGVCRWRCYRMLVDVGVVVVVGDAIAAR